VFAYIDSMGLDVEVGCWEDCGIGTCKS